MSLDERGNLLSDLIIPISNSEIDYGDIVEWQQDSSTVLKGIVTAFIAPNQSANDVFHIGNQIKNLMQ